MLFATYRRILFSAILGGGLLFSFYSVQAQQAVRPTINDPCPSAMYCLVPAPTVMAPRPEQTISSSQAVITGLSWNQTKVDVYIDGDYAGRATLRTDVSEIGNFFFYPKTKLAAGQHTVFTVARNLSELERSFDSPKITFTVKTAVVAPVPSGSKTAAPADSGGKDQTTEQKVAPDDNSSANSVLDNFFNRESSDASGTATSTNVGAISGKKAWGVVAVIIFAVILIAAFRAKRRILPPTSGTSDGSPPDLPPPPA